jgi:hypothetical protein
MQVENRLGWLPWLSELQYEIQYFQGHLPPLDRLRRRSLLGTRFNEHSGVWDADVWEKPEARATIEKLEALHGPLAEVALELCWLKGHLNGLNVATRSLGIGDFIEMDLNLYWPGDPSNPESLTQWSLHLFGRHPPPLVSLRYPLVSEHVICRTQTLDAAFAKWKKAIRVTWRVMHAHCRYWLAVLSGHERKQLEEFGWPRKALQRFDRRGHESLEWPSQPPHGSARSADSSEASTAPAVAPSAPGVQPDLPTAPAQVKIGGVTINIVDGYLAAAREGLEPVKLQNKERSFLIAISGKSSIPISMLFGRAQNAVWSERYQELPRQLNLIRNMASDVKTKLDLAGFSVTISTANGQVSIGSTSIT